MFLFIPLANALLLTLFDLLNPLDLDKLPTELDRESVGGVYAGVGGGVSLT